MHIVDEESLGQFRDGADNLEARFDREVNKLAACMGSASKAVRASDIEILADLPRSCWGSVMESRVLRDIEKRNIAKQFKQERLIELEAMEAEQTRAVAQQSRLERLSL